MVLTEDSDLVIADEVAQLGFVFDQTIGCYVVGQRPGHFPKQRSHARKLALAW